MMGNVGCCQSGYLGLSCTDQDDSFFNLSRASRPTLWRSVYKSLERPFNVSLSLSCSPSVSLSLSLPLRVSPFSLPPPTSHSFLFLSHRPPPSLSPRTGRCIIGWWWWRWGWGGCTDMCAPPLHNVWIIAGVKWIWTCSQCWEVEEVRAAAAAAHICRTAGRSDAEDFCWKSYKW